MIAVLLVASCADALNALVPREGYNITRDIDYGEAPAQKLDIYTPDAAAGGQAHPAKVVIFFHGGNWRSGDRGMYRFVGQMLASMGYVAVIADYRLYPEVKYPVFLEDCAAAVRWTQAHIGYYGGDGDRIFIMGHSAGAYNALMVALDQHYAKDLHLSGVIGLAGPYDFLPMTGEDVREVFGDAADSPLTQPIHYAHAGAPPALLMTGLSDETVRPRNSERLAAALRAERDEAVLREYPDVGHIRLVLGLSPIYRNDDMRAEIKQFIDMH